MPYLIFGVLCTWQYTFQVFTQCFSPNVVATVLEILSALIFLKPTMKCKIFLTLQISNKKWGLFTKFEFYMFINDKDIELKRIL